MQWTDLQCGVIVVISDVWIIKSVYSNILPSAIAKLELIGYKQSENKAACAVVKATWPGGCRISPHK